MTLEEKTAEVVLRMARSRENDAEGCTSHLEEYASLCRRVVEGCKAWTEADLDEYLAERDENGEYLADEEDDGGE